MDEALRLALYTLLAIVSLWLLTEKESRHHA
jgi:hypothetical protein